MFSMHVMMLCHNCLTEGKAEVRVSNSILGMQMMQVWSRPDGWREMPLAIGGEPIWLCGPCAFKNLKES